MVKKNLGFYQPCTECCVYFPHSMYVEQLVSFHNQIRHAGEFESEGKIAKFCKIHCKIHCKMDATEEGPVTLNTTGRETPYFLLTSGLQHGPWRHAAANK